MKTLSLLLSILLVTACGGSTTENVEDDWIPELYSYKITIDNETRSYNGDCILREGKYYCWPITIADNDFVVTAVFDEKHIKLFDWFDRSLILEYNFADENQYHFSMTEKENETDIGNLDGQWLNRSYISRFNAPYIVGHHQEGMINGSDTLGCIYNGTAELVGNIYEIDMTITNCMYAGEYTGALKSIIRDMNDQEADEWHIVHGLISNGNYAIPMDFYTEYYYQK